MLTHPSNRHRSTWISHPQVLFGLAVVLPGLLVAAVGWRTIDADRREALRQLDDRLDNVAERALTELETELRRWDAAVVEFDSVRPPVVSSSSTTVAALSGSVGAVTIRVEHDRVSVEPRSRLLFDPENAAADVSSPPLPATVAAAERVEFTGDYAGAVERYQRLLRDATRAMRPALLLRLARTFQKAGRSEDAMARYRELALLNGDTVGSLPADLVARFEICSLFARAPSATDARACHVCLYEDLVQGQWRLSRRWYTFYVDRLREALWGPDGGAPEVKRMADLEAEKMVLTLAAADTVTFLRRRDLRSGTGHLGLRQASRKFLAIWHQPESSDRCVAVLLPAPALLAGRVAAALLPIRDRDDVQIAIADGDGPALYQSAIEPNPPGTGAHIRRRSRQDGDIVWTATVWPRRPGAIEADMARRRLLYIAMLGVVLASVVVGSVLTARTVARELEVARIKAQFVSAVSHEFRTPLAGIRQFAEMLVHDRVEGDERRRRYLGLILGASERLSRLVDNVLDFARIEEGRQAYHLVPVDTTPWLRGVVTEFQDALPPERKVIAEVPDGLPAIMADGHALGRAVHNLLDNAVKYSPGQPAVWLEAAVEDAALALQVRDHGVGISESDRAHVFERFFRGAALSQTVGGAGLGLSLVQHIATAHKGQVTCDSKPGESTTFVLRIPLGQESEAGSLP
jgi:signal transduction histidine kinase